MAASIDTASHRICSSPSVRARWISSAIPRACANATSRSCRRMPIGGWRRSSVSSSTTFLDRSWHSCSSASANALPANVNIVRNWSCCSASSCCKRSSSAPGCDIQPARKQIIPAAAGSQRTTPSSRRCQRNCSTQATGPGCAETCSAARNSRKLLCTNIRCLGAGRTRRPALRKSSIIS